MVKKNITLSISSELLDEFDKVNFNRSAFVELSMRKCIEEQTGELEVQRTFEKCSYCNQPKEKLEKLSDTIKICNECYHSLPTEEINKKVKDDN